MRFSRTLTSGEGYLLPPEEILRRCVEARQWGATEVCLQAGLAPGVTGMTYVELCRSIHQALPDLHIHAFSPEEIKYGAAQSGLSIQELLQALKEAGLGSLPGTSAEILDDRIRDRISPGRITTAEWMEVIKTAHGLGIPTTSTMMFGHVETVADQMRHMDLLRSIQQETGGFTEFVPLSFVHQEAPLFLRSVSATRPGPTGHEVTRLYAICRLMLGSSIGNIQASWVKEGWRQAQGLLTCGVNDLGGTLINESISTSAGASHGQLMQPAVLRHGIRDAGRIPVQRSTLYQPLQVFSTDPSQDPLDPLDHVQDPEAEFGSYDSLIQDPRFRYSRDLAKR
ncbi:MAG: 5-amino-6-(D-ribitylamino)uracil--L-tyrosine 4-hydroxyphenyl transferase CofH [Synechococcaceae cyanobacterium RM1_1_27]|nr:5-amino-6-(D-ribitylamino)uracil--L-tyrosine 4-hydroxyphenyl transferase CofH [Synechococcaceae cyanobacterium RM1_1_27]